jgi:tetratricopeptide (TPR) repeat protein/CHAT domain-containing protein
MPKAAQGRFWGIRASIVRLGLLASCSLGMLAADDSRPSHSSSEQTGAAEQKRARHAELRRLAKEAEDLRTAGKLSEAVATGQKIVVLARRQYGNTSETVAGWHEWLANTQEKLEQWPAAQKSRAEVLVIRGKIYGEDDWHMMDARLALEQTVRLSTMTAAQRELFAKAVASNQQVLLLIGKGKFADALPAAQEALEIRKKLLGDSHPDTVTSLQNLAFVMWRMGNDAQAEPLYQQALEIMKKAGWRRQPLTATIAKNLGLLYRKHRDYSKAEPLLRESLEIRTKTLGSKHATTISILDELLTLYDQMRRDTRLGDPPIAEKLTEALATCEKGAAMARRRDGETSETVAGWNDWLGQLYEKRQEWPGALRAREKALVIREALHGDGDWRATDARMSLEQTLRFSQMAAEERELLLKANRLNQQVLGLINKGRYADALPLAAEALAIREKLVGESHYDTTVSLHNLAFTHWKLGNDAKAEPLLQQSRASLKKSAGNGHPLAATVAESLGLLYRARRDYAKAEPLLREAFETRKQDFGEKNKLTVETFNEVVSVYDRLQREMTAEDFKSPEKAAQAIVLADKAVLLARQRFGESSEEVAGRHEWLAQLHEKRDEWDAAKKERQEVLSIRTRIYGEQHWRTRAARTALDQIVPLSQSTAGERDLLAKATTLNFQVVALIDKGRFADGLPAAKEALEIRKKALGPTHSDTASSLHNLAYLYWRLGKDAEAAPLFQQAIDAYRKNAGEGSPNMATSLDCLGLLYRDRRDFAKAESVLQEALVLRKKILGEQHADTTSSLNSLGALYAQQKEFAKAEPLYRQAIEISKKVASGENRTMATYLHNLGLLYRDKGDSAQAEPLLRQSFEIRKKVLGPQHADTIQYLYDLAHFYKQTRDYAKAEPLYREALEIRKKALGDLHPDTAASLNDLGVLYDIMREYAKAEPLYQQALDIRKKVLGPEHALTVLSLRNLGIVRENRRAFAEAEPLLREVLVTRKKTLGPENPLYASSLYDLATLYDAEGEYARAEPLYREALAIRKKVLGETNLDYALSLNTLGSMYQAQGDYVQAEALYRQALAIRKKVSGEMNADYARTLNNLADLCRLQADYAHAEALYLEALAIRKKVVGERDPAYSQSINNLALLYGLQGNHAKAEPLFRQAQEICRKVLGEAHPDYATSLINLANSYQSQGDHARAETLLLQAIEIDKKAFGETHPSYAIDLSSLAAVYKSQRDYARAEKLFRRALDINKKALGELHPQYASDLAALASIYHSLGDYDRAEPLLREALGIRRKALGEAHPSYAQSLNNLAELHSARGEYAQAERLLREALAARKKSLGEAHTGYAQSLNSLAFLYRSQGEDARAEPLCRQALEIYERHFNRSVSGQSERQQLLLAQSLRWNLDAYVSVTATAPVGADDVYRHVLGWKGAVFLRQYASRAARNRPELKPLFENLESISIRLSNLALRVPDAKGRAAWERQISLLSEQKETIERDLGNKSAEFRQQQTLLDMTPDELKKHLPNKTALIDFLEYFHSTPNPQKPGNWRWERRVVAFVVRRDQPIVRIELGTVKPLADATESWRRAILHDGGTSEEVSANGTANDPKPPQQFLAETIWRPAQKHLDGVETVLVSPDGVLNRVPLAALPGKKEGSYLVEDYRLAVAPVPRLISTIFDEADGGKSEKTATVAAGGKDSLLIVGDVTYGSRPGKSEGALVASRSAVRGSQAGSLFFPDLEYSRSEMVTIRDTFEVRFPDAKVRTLRRERATEEAFRQEAPQCRWLHLATHGFFAPPELASALAAQKVQKDKENNTQFGRQGISGFNPGLLSGLALSGANVRAEADEDDGILTAVEVAGLNLEHVDLVVLSACETGLGEVAGGEGVLGLQRAFQLSGAKTAVTSLWKIPDRATSQLMQRFYENLWDRKMSKVDALRDAQIGMLKEGRQRGLDIEEPASKKPISSRLPPKYWAAFVLSGDWR